MCSNFELHPHQVFPEMIVGLIIAKCDKYGTLGIDPPGARYVPKLVMKTAFN